MMFFIFLFSILQISRAADSPSSVPSVLHSPARAPSMAEIIASSKDSDWREPSPENTLYMELPQGRVVIELAPRFAPNHVENLKKLSCENYWDGLDIVRVQDNYVVQWADPNAEKPESKRKIKTGKESLNAEFDRDVDSSLGFSLLKDGDVYAKQVGFTDGFAVGRDPQTKKTWLLHCYGSVGAGRDESIDSGGGTELYAVIGHSPRQLDRNVSLLGRVVQGMEFLSSLPRGSGNMGFYEKIEQHVKIKSLHLASDYPEKDRTKLEIMRTDTPTFTRLIESRRNRPEAWFHRAAGKIEICNVPIPTRLKK